MKLDKFIEDNKFTSKEELTGIASIIHPEKGDVLVINVEVSRMPPSKVTQHLERLAVNFKSTLPKDLKVIYVPMRDGVKGIEFDLLKF